MICCKRPRGSVYLERTFNASRYRGKRIHLSAQIQTEQVEEQARLILEGSPMKGDRVEHLFRGSQAWETYTLDLLVSEASPGLSFGLALNGRGKIRLRNVHLEMLP